MMQALLTILFFFLMVSPSSCLVLAANASALNVLDYGADGDGKTDSSKAFSKAWDDLCKADQGLPTLVVPKGKIFLLNPITFNGPCKSSNIQIQIDGTIIAPNNVDAWPNDKEKWLQFDGVNGLTVHGTGQIDGQGHVWWEACKGKERSCSRPSAVSFNNCNNLQLNGLTHLNSQKNHISINQCRNVDISNLNIIAPDESPNTDGIDICKSTQMSITNSFIGTGDDCIAINGFSSYINISGIACGPGHGISIGSLGKNGSYETVEEVYVWNCTFNGTQNGARIKTWQGGSGYVKTVSFKQIILVNSQNPIIIDQNYDPNSMSGLSISDITYDQVYGSCPYENAITFDCLNAMGCTNIVMTNVNITNSIPGKTTYASCNNAHGICRLCSPDVGCLN